MELTRKYRCDSPTCNKSSTRAPLLLLYHVCGPSWNLQVYLINFPHPRICFIITISTTNKSFFQLFLNILCFFSFHPLILSFFVQPQLSFLIYIYNHFYLNPELSLFRHWTVTVLFLNCCCLFFWTVTVSFFNCYCLVFELLLSYFFELLLSKYWTVTLRPLLRFLTISRVIELRFKRD